MKVLDGPHVLWVRIVSSEEGSNGQEGNRYYPDFSDFQRGGYRLVRIQPQPQCLRCAYRQMVKAPISPLAAAQMN